MLSVDDGTGYPNGISFWKKFHYLGFTRSVLLYAYEPLLGTISLKRVCAVAIPGLPCDFFFPVWFFISWLKYCIISFGYCLIMHIWFIVCYLCSTFLSVALIDYMDWCRYSHEHPVFYLNLLPTSFQVLMVELVFWVLRRKERFGYWKFFYYLNHMFWWKHDI